MAKRFLVVAAQQEELDGLFHNQKSVKKVADFYVLENTDFVIYGIIGGIGKTAMAFRIGSFLQNIAVDEIINIGVAGSISKELKPLEIMIATKSAYHDVDLTPFGKPKGQMSDCPLYFECDKNGLDVARTFNIPEVKFGLIVSGDIFVTKDNLTTDLYENFDNPIACDMESAAVGQCAHIADIPYMIIRAISDDANSEANKNNYERTLVDASKEAGELAYKIIENLSRK